MTDQEIIIELEKLKQKALDDFLFAREQVMRAEIKLEDSMNELIKELRNQIARKSTEVLK